ncbi:MAG: BsuPI-related putative proteinase inhibitor [Gemmatimonadaceae bacterium]
MVTELELPTRVAAREAVPIVLRVRNAGRERVELMLTGRPVAFDLVVMGADRTVVWRRLHGAAVSSMLQATLVGPGETLEFTERWLQQDNAGGAVPPGTYSIQGILPVEGGQLVTRAREIVISR